MNYNHNKEKVWSLRYTPGNAEVDAIISEIASRVGISPVCASLIYNRGLRDAHAVAAFLSTSTDKLYDPMLMADMGKAVTRVIKALDRGEKITVYGDYDVDGVTSVTLIYLYLKSLGAEIDYYIPSRSKEGYGLSEMALDSLKEKGTQLIITVDTGITANAEAEYAKGLGMEMVITDHHECHGDIPSACAVVNPHRADCNYPFKELAGVGVVFKLACALECHMHPEESRDSCVARICRDYIDLVAIGTVADVMPLVSENRIIVKHGLEAISSTERCGLAALIDAASSTSVSSARVGERTTPKKRKINAGFIGFSIAPRINAAGRISSAQKAVALLLCEDPTEAAIKAEELCEINLRRQMEENGIAEEAYKMIEEKHDFSRDKVIVLDGNTWQQGIIGIVSSRITEKYGLPSILVSFDGAVGDEPSQSDVGKGSGRSVKGMNLVEALSYCEELLVRFGGHELAAGLSVKRENLDKFREKINEYASQRLGDDLTVIKYEADCELSPREADMRLATELLSLEPFGVANETPLFLIKELTLEKIIPMGGGKHSKLLLSAEGREIQAVFFGAPADSLEYYSGERIDMLCRLNINEFRGKESLQLVVQDIRLSESCAEAQRAEKAKYLSAAEGDGSLADGGILPDREDIAELYRILKYEAESGNKEFSFRALQSRLRVYYGREMGYARLRFALTILNEMKVCRIGFEEDTVKFELCQCKDKASIETTETYIKLTKLIKA